MALRPLPAVQAGQTIRQFSASYGLTRLIYEPAINHKQNTFMFTFVN